MRRPDGEFFRLTIYQQRPHLQINRCPLIFAYHPLNGGPLPESHHMRLGSGYRYWAQQQNPQQQSANHRHGSQITIAGLENARTYEHVECLECQIGNPRSSYRLPARMTGFAPLCLKRFFHIQ